MGVVVKGGEGEGLSFDWRQEQVAAEAANNSMIINNRRKEPPTKPSHLPRPQHLADPVPDQDQLPPRQPRAAAARARVHAQQVAVAVEVQRAVQQVGRRLEDGLGRHVGRGVVVLRRSGWRGGMGGWLAVKRRNAVGRHWPRQLPDSSCRQLTSTASLRCKQLSPAPAPRRRPQSRPRHGQTPRRRRRGWWGRRASRRTARQSASGCG